MLGIMLSQGLSLDREHPASSRRRREPRPWRQLPKPSSKPVLLEHKHNGQLVSKPDSNSKLTNWQLATPRPLLFAEL